METWNKTGILRWMAAACWVLMLSAGTARAQRLTEASRINAAAEWHEAALNYENAASAQMLAAEGIGRQAQALRGAPPEDAGARRRGVVHAGNLEIRAADMFLAAAANFDHAARTMRQAASSAATDSATRHHLVAFAETSRQRATQSIRRAAEFCEQAALGFSAIEDPVSQAAASQKAAVIREQLARR